MVVKCEMCGREFKTTQGLRGHKTFVHQMTSSSKPRATQALEELTRKLELLDERLANFTIRVDKLAERYEKLSRFIQYELAGIQDDIIWEIALVRPEFKRRSHKLK